MDREFRVSTHGQIEVRASESGQVLTGYAALFNTYSENLGGFVEQVAPGAFADTIARGSNIAALGNHEDSWLLGTTGSGTLRLSEDSIGLRYEVDLDATDPDAVRMAAKVRTGKMPGSSFSFTIIAGGQKWSETDAGFPLRTLTNLRLYDVGPVTFPAYAATQGADVAVALRSLSDAKGVSFDAVEAAYRAGDVRTALNDSGDTDDGPGPTTRNLSVARARLALAERVFPA